MKRLEKHIEAEIIRALKDMGCAVTKTSQPRPSMLTRGIPDLYASNAKWGIRVWLEVKRPGEKPTAYQKAWHAAERAAGGNVAVVTSVAETVEVLRELGAPIQTRAA